jgi:hypothetical protein
MLELAVETFGDVPYSQSLNPGNMFYLFADDAATIYSDLLTRLNAAILTNTGFGRSNLCWKPSFLEKVW